MAKTKSGFEFELDEEVRDDIELLEALTKLDKGDMTYMSDVITGLLGEDQKKALYEHCRSPKGRVRASKVMEELKSIFEVLNEQDNPVKNS